MKLKPKPCALAALDKSIRIFTEKLNVAKPSSILPEGRKLLARMAPPPGSLADHAARRSAGRLMIDELLAHHQRTKKKGYRHFLLTLCWDAGVLSADKPFEYDLKAMQIKAYKAIKKLGLSAVCVFEAVALRKSKRNAELLIIHLHAVCWARAKTFKPIVAAEDLMKRCDFPNWLGAPSVSIQSRAMAANRFKDKRSAQYRHLFSKLDKDQTKASMAWLGYYLFQAPAWVKQLVPKKKREDKLALRSNSKNYSSQLALALEQLLTEIQTTDAVFSVGDGKSILGPWRQKFRQDLVKRDLPKLSQKSRKMASKARVRRRRAQLLKRLGRQGEDM